ncbi:MAG: chemotaxis protein CheA [Euryarchaeota archaeon]|nr:chemotaxis protein CheA [Euryarchaeota archaeon]MBU4340492.1 chemotaxis protein CheA [Euryarchaeota archaeon]MBU4453794.1 chemotaxis protein CheA [Euryarchaeota archaeon]MCG2737930.1 chemotaxis protein CheA [Candidatus Methanoperedenaceae archaeon]
MPEKDKLDLSIFLEDYCNDAKEYFREINSAMLELEKDHSKVENLNEIFRALHSLKSSSNMLEFTDIAEFSHLCEEPIDRMRKTALPITQDAIDVIFEAVDALNAMVNQKCEKKGDKFDHRAAADKVKRLISNEAPPEQEVIGTARSAIPTIEKTETVRVHVDILNSLFNLVGELILNKNRIDNLVSGSENKKLRSALSAMDHIIAELQENVSVSRLVPADEIFQKFPRMVRDLAKEQKKEVEFEVVGGENELDKSVLDAIGEPLIHLIRNSIDHGIELPEIREKEGKKRTGTVKLVAKRAENNILIEVEDDGKGMDMAHMKEAAINKGFIKPEEAEAVEDSDIMETIFRPGFSTAEKVTGVSGRGIGLDIVRTATKKLGGSVEVATEKGRGSRFTLALPLTTAVVQTLMVGVGEHVFVMPSDIVIETLDVKPEFIKEVGKDKALVLRKNVIPFISLAEVLNIPVQEGQKNQVALIIQRGNRFIGVGVDAVLDQTENIIKPFDSIAAKFKGFSGGTILGDGRVALMLDIPGLIGFETLRKEVYSI